MFQFLKKITFRWYNLKRLKLTNFWHNMPSAAAKIFRRNFSTKIEVADKKFCTSYITQFAVSSKIFQKNHPHCVAWLSTSSSLGLTWPDFSQIGVGSWDFQRLMVPTTHKTPFEQKPKKVAFSTIWRKKLCGIFFCFSIWEGSFSFICLPVKKFVNGHFINLLSKN